MSVKYNSEWYAPAIGPEKQIGDFWEHNTYPVKYVGNDKCVYILESYGDNFSIIHDSLKFPDIVFYGLIHSKIDMTQWWINVVVKNGDIVITHEVPGDDWDSVWCNGLTALFPERGYIIPYCDKHLYIKMPEDESDVPLQSKSMDSSD